jgi:hypothetical protein
MKLGTPYRAVIGGLIWIALIAGVVFSIRHVSSTSTSSVNQLLTYASRQRRQIQLELPFDLNLKVRDPIYLEGSDDTKPIGVVSHVDTVLDGNDKVWVSMFGSCPTVAEGDHLEFHRAADSVDWMLRTMFHDEKKKELKQLIQNAIDANQKDLVAAFKPVVVSTLSKTSNLVKEDLQKAIAERRPQLKELGNRYQNEVLQKKLMPVFQEEVWPIVQAESEPLVTDISREIWNEVSVFGFGWRYLYDRSPLPERKLTERKFKQFVDEKAKPIIASHLDEFIELQKSISVKVAANEKVKQTLSESFRAAADDPEIQQLLTDVFQEVFVKNTRLHEAIAEQWSSPDAKKAFAVANSKLDPVIREIGVSLFGSPDGGITPEFAKVLRRRILHKDSQWLTLHCDNVSPVDAQSRSKPFPTTLPVMISRDDTGIPVFLKGEKVE